MSTGRNEAADSPRRATVIIVNFNAGPKLLGCLASVSSSLPSDAEVILVDNASSDGSAEKALILSPCMRLLRSRDNRGFGAGGNLGAREARGRDLVFLNPDTIVEPGWIEALLADLEQYPEAGLTTSRILQADRTDRISGCGNSVHVSGLTLARGMGAPRGAFREIEEVDAVSGAAFAIPRDLFEQLGGFDEDFFLYVEDTDLSLRARLAGRRCLYVPQSIVYHDYTFRLTPLKVFYQERNRYLMLLKCFRWPTLVALFPSLLLAELLTWGFVLLRDRRNAANKLRAYAWVFRNWSAILQKRKITRSGRKISDRAILLTTGHRLDFRQVATPGIAKAARLIFDPLFFLSRILALAVVWW